MKPITFLVSIILTVSCKPQVDFSVELTDLEWYNSISTGGTFAGLSAEEFLLFKTFDNNQLSNGIINAYSNGSSILGYKINDSLINYLETRQNRIIRNKLDTMLNISFISDTLEINRPYLVLSEPFYLNNEIISFSLAYRSRDNLNGHWIYFFKRQNRNLIILGLFDTRKEMYYEAIKP